MENKDEFKIEVLNYIQNFVVLSIGKIKTTDDETLRLSYKNFDSLYSILLESEKHFKEYEANPLIENNLIEFLYLHLYHIGIKGLIDNINEFKNNPLTDKHLTKEFGEVDMMLFYFYSIASKIIWLNDYKDAKKIHQATLN